MHKLRNELTQVRATTSTPKFKLTIVKAPASTASPNLADAVVMAKWPLPSAATGLITGFTAPVVIRS